jgi:hypothetical protein
MVLLMSATSGMFSSPRPPRLRGVLTHAKWLNWLSMLTPTTWAPSFSNSGARSEKAMISVGQTKVKSRG